MSSRGAGFGCGWSCGDGFCFGSGGGCCGGFGNLVFFAGGPGAFGGVLSRGRALTFGRSAISLSAGRSSNSGASSTMVGPEGEINNCEAQKTSKATRKQWKGNTPQLQQGNTPFTSPNVLGSRRSRPQAKLAVSPAALPPSASAATGPAACPGALPLLACLVVHGHPVAGLGSFPCLLLSLPPSSCAPSTALTCVRTSGTTRFQCTTCSGNGSRT